MIDLAEYQRLRKAAESLQRDADRAEGLLESIDRRFLADFGCSWDQAERLLIDLETEERKLMERCGKMVEKLRADFPQLGKEQKP